MTRKGIIPGMEKDDEMSWKGLYLERTCPEMFLCVERTDPRHDVCSNRKKSCNWPCPCIYICLLKNYEEISLFKKIAGIM